MKMKQGISLIVLSITILVMAILAATAIIALEDSGIIGRAKSTTSKQNCAEEYTRLQVIKNGILTDNLGTITIEEFITELRNEDLLEAGQTNNADGSVTVITKTGFKVTLLQNGANDLKIGIEGYKEISDNNGGLGNTTPSPDDSTSEPELEENKLSGKWQLNETLTQTGWASGDTAKQQAINYTISSGGSNPIAKELIAYGTYKMQSPSASGTITSYCYYISTTGAHLYSIYHFDIANDCGSSIGYDLSTPIILDFGTTPQEVDADFYAWFIANATKQ